jgi:4-amino-4-deoxy-L-arabinose transferase-like glycosyltransferase
LSPARRYLPVATLALAIAAFYLYGLNRVGVMLPDEPRYAAIGLAMARTGDLITPRLWGSPWFEKPPLVYWFTAAAASTGLGPELAARLPIALLSLVFLVIFVLLLKDEFGFAVSATATALLGTSAGWIVYSEFCLTDLPLAVFFSLAVLFALPLLRQNPPQSRIALRFGAIGVCIGIGTLAKGLVPVALALPFAWFLRAYWRKWWIAFLAFLVTSLPWYAAVYARNGDPFLDEFFIKHHFERLYSASLQHAQPWYFYFPVLLAGIFPWTPLVVLLARRAFPWDHRRRFLAVIVVFGFLLFSISLNKLPGYLLPLFPALFAVIASSLKSENPLQFSRAWLLPCAALTAAIPIAAKILPDSLSVGKLTAQALSHFSPTECFYIALPILAVFLARRSWAGPVLALCLIAGAFYLKILAYPILDGQVSARQFWRELHRTGKPFCVVWINRDMLYGLSFYDGKLVPQCVPGTHDLKLISAGHGLPHVMP